MKKEGISIRIPEPCHEDWNKMQQDDKGRFCNSCSKSVYDFTGKTDTEISSILMENRGEKICGHFKITQLNRPLKLDASRIVIPKRRSFNRKPYII